MGTGKKSQYFLINSFSFHSSKYSPESPSKSKIIFVPRSFLSNSDSLNSIPSSLSQITALLSFL